MVTNFKHMKIHKLRNGRTGTRDLSPSCCGHLLLHKYVRDDWDAVTCGVCLSAKPKTEGADGQP